MYRCFRNFGQEFNLKEKELRENQIIDESSEPLFSKFGKYYRCSDSVIAYVTNYPDSFDSRETRFGIGQNNIAKISFEDKNWNVGDLVTQIDLTLDLAKEREVTLQFWFDK